MPYFRVIVSSPLSDIEIALPADRVLLNEYAMPAYLQPISPSPSPGQLLAGLRPTRIYHCGYVSYYTPG